MNLAIANGSLPSHVILPGSKSYANRALILASLKKGDVQLRFLPTSSDVTFLQSCLEKIGLQFQGAKDSPLVVNSFPECETGDKELEVGEGGTTARFLAAMVLRGRCQYRLILGDRLKQRPWEEFIQLVRDLGGEASLDDCVLTLRGPLQLKGDLEVDCTRTTQFASGLQLAFGDMGLKVLPNNMESSQSYWEMTMQMLQHFSSHDHYDVPLDWSSASYPLAFGALNHSILLPGLKFDAAQADAKFLELLSSLGAIKMTSEGIEVYPLTVKSPVELAVHDCLDLVPTLGYLLAHIPGVHKLQGVHNLVHKESDRLAEVIKLVSAFGRKAFHQDDCLFIEGREERLTSPVHLQLPDDHRMVMCAALFLRHHAGGTLSPAQAVQKSWPEFFELFSQTSP